MGLASRGYRESSEPRVEPNVGDELLRIEGLRVEFHADSGLTTAVREFDASLRAGTVVGVAGESGSGKTTLALAAMGLLPPGASVSGSIRYFGTGIETELLSLSEKDLRSYRGRHLGMIFQETTAALNPVMRIGDQLTMAARAHIDGNKAVIRERVVAALEDVRLTDTDRVMSSYPHELSGGQCQRIMIAMALSCGSRLLFADEPTTALDVSVQKEILKLIRDLVVSRNLAVLIISHDLAVLAEICDELLIMYRGEIVEVGPIQEILNSPAHPYTRALLDCLPHLHGRRGRLPELPPSEAVDLPGDGCRFRNRCVFAVDACVKEPALLDVSPGLVRRARCWRSGEVLESGVDAIHVQSFQTQPRDSLESVAATVNTQSEQLDA